MRSMTNNKNSSSTANSSCEKRFNQEVRSAASQSDAKNTTTTTKNGSSSGGDSSSATASHDAFAVTQGDSSTDVKVYSEFEDMPLNQRLLRGIYSHGFEKPSAIQQRAIVPLLQGGDIIGQAHAGTGKTGAFAIGLLQRLDFRNTSGTTGTTAHPSGTAAVRQKQRIQAIILAPTRELAQQTMEVTSAIGDYLNPEGFCTMFVGGTRVTEDLKCLEHCGTTVAVGTPGRLGDLIKRGALRTDSVKTIIIDEADEMLSQGFTEQVYGIFKYLPKTVQVALFSATMPDDVLALTRKFMREPTRILLQADKLTLKDVKQYYVAVEEEDKLPTVMDLYENLSIAQCVIFTNRREKVDWLAHRLNANGHTVSSMHSDMERGERTKVMGTFKSGSSRVLVTTDLVARGIDVQHVNVVVNFDLPTSVENYIHRIGRSGRFGKKGVAINLVSQRQAEALRAIEAHYHTEIEELPMDFATYLSMEATK